jgi:glycosyltransferase involved in cell wall biosynthesis
MIVGWLQDAAEIQGGAELTAKSFRDAAPDSVEIVDCPPGQIREADVYVVHNSTTYPVDTQLALRGRPVVRYIHDTIPHGSPALRAWLLLGNAHLIFCSPLHRGKFPHPFEGDVSIIPPPCDLTPAGDTPKTKGAIWLGHALNPGKGIGNAVSWADRTQTQLDFVGEGPLMPPESDLIKVLPGVPFDAVPATLAEYEKFVFLPSKLEPFGRSVVEAWAAGCELVINQMIGARHYIENDRDALVTAPKDFWNVVLNAS